LLRARQIQRRRSNCICQNMPMAIPTRTRLQSDYYPARCFHFDMFDCSTPSRAGGVHSIRCEAITHPGPARAGEPIQGQFNSRYRFLTGAIGGVIPRQIGGRLRGYRERISSRQRVLTRATVMPHFQARQRLEVVLFMHPNDRSCVPDFAPDDMRAKRFCERPITQARHRGSRVIAPNCHSRAG
jgi:hypothetical protein